jgi:3-methyladenine DNA glycosylase/8-oxoguanine DNA glycosylase
MPPSVDLAAAGVAPGDPELQATLRLDRPVDLRLTLGPLWRGPGDVTTRLFDRELMRATRTPDGPASLRVSLRDGTAEATAWGPGAGWALDRLPALLGQTDDDASFRPQHRLLMELRRRLVGLRLTRSEAVLEALVPAVLDQKVPSVQASQSHLRLLRALATPAPGPLGLRLPPAPADLAATPLWVFHRAGVERRRADIVCRCGLLAARLEEAAAMSPEAATGRLMAVPGVGPWTAATVTGLALGDPDAVPLGDYHFPHLVTWALAGVPRGDDARMLELLEPYRGQRGRVIRLLLAGGINAPRFGPRQPLRDIARQ